MGWWDYLDGQVALAEIDEDEAQSILERTKALVFLEGVDGVQAKDVKITIERAQRTADKRVADAEFTYHVAHARRKLLQPMLRSAERRANFLSREVTRRVGMEPANRRNRNYST